MCARCFTMTVCFSLMLNCGNNIDATDNCCIKCPKNLSKIGSSGQHDYKMMSYLSHEEEFNSGGINYYKANHHLQFQSACKSAYASDVITACRLSNLYNFNVLLVCVIVLLYSLFRIYSVIFWAIIQNASPLTCYRSYGKIRCILCTQPCVCMLCLYYVPVSSLDSSKRISQGAGSVTYHCVILYFLCLLHIEILLRCSIIISGVLVQFMSLLCLLIYESCHIYVPLCFLFYFEKSVPCSVCLVLLSLWRSGLSVAAVFPRCFHVPHCPLVY